MHVLLDVNVLLDAMLQRHPWHKEADAILNAAALEQVTCAVTTFSLATLFYVVRKTVGTSAARAGVRTHLAAFNMLPVDKQALVDADADFLKRLAATISPPLTGAGPTTGAP